MAQPEARLRARCAMFLRSHAPGLWFSAIEHGRRHSGDAAQRAREWQRLAAQGLRPGLGDMLVIPAGPVLWVECKVGSNGQSDAQRTMQRDMEERGHGYVVIRSVEQLGEELEARGIPLAPGWRVAAMHHDAALDGEAPVRKRPRKPRVAEPKPTRTQITRANAAMLAMVRR